jgi:hypothetical protein
VFDKISILGRSICFGPIASNNYSPATQATVMVGLAGFVLCLVGGMARAQPATYYNFRSVLSSGNQNWCINIPRTQFEPGVVVAIASCNGSPAQTFNYETRINLTAGGVCLDGIAQQGNPLPGEGDPAGLWECIGTDNQVWDLQPFRNNPNVFSIVNPAGLCITVDGNIGPNAPLILSMCMEMPSQGWINRQVVQNQRVRYQQNFAEPQYYYRGGSRYCYYDDAWNGAGWYTCGSQRSRGVGYGGPRFWNNWYYPGQVYRAPGGGGGTTYYPTQSPNLPQTTINTTINTTTTQSTGNLQSVGSSNNQSSGNQGTTVNPRRPLDDGPRPNQGATVRSNQGSTVDPRRPLDDGPRPNQGATVRSNQGSTVNSRRPLDDGPRPNQGATVNRLETAASGAT